MKAKMFAVMVALTGMLGVIAPPANADLVLTLDEHFGEVPSTGFVTATFSQVNATTVSLVMDASTLGDAEFVDGGAGWYFNFNPSLDISDANFSYQFGAVFNTLQVGIDDFQADGDGIYDFVFDFVSGDLGGADANNGTSEYHITLAGGLSIDDFEFLSVSGGGAGSPFFSAAHIQSTGDDQEGSDWMGAPIPAPGAVLLGLLGLGLVGGVRRRVA